MRATKKSDLPSKICPSCDHGNKGGPHGRPYFWRKKWAAVWAEVKYCSERCRRNRQGKS
ncbi:MAG: DUF2256 domain-containing protein [Azonexus sp.]|nr:DUF2256 domain-containing protein [Azonexus sp.]MDP3637820.1 DUF2256 domain-containing protein [Azonexus sp.]MDZ4314241.1 DUF2256 domain-containing protein [Azonexus sp.]